MKSVRWDTGKEKLLKEGRNIDFNRIAVLIEEKEFLGVIDVPSRAGQKMFLLDYDEYLVCVPFVENDNEIFLKTAYRNRKLNKKVSHEKKQKDSN